VNSNVLEGKAIPAPLDTRRVTIILSKRRYINYQTYCPYVNNNRLTFLFI